MSRATEGRQRQGMREGGRDGNEGGREAGREAGRSWDKVQLQGLGYCLASDGTTPPAL